MRTLTGFAMAAVAMIMSMLAMPAAALLVTNTSMNSPSTVHITDGTVNKTVELGELYFGSVTSGIGEFCIDVFHDITLGTQTPPLSFHVGTFTTDFGGHALSVGTMKQIMYLADLAGKKRSSTDLVLQMAAQARIWQLEGATLDHFSNQEVFAEVTVLSRLTKMARSVRPILVSDDWHQSFIPPGVVTEPASWAMMIMGFGLVGIAIRRQSASTPVVAS